MRNENAAGADFAAVTERDVARDADSRIYRNKIAQLCVVPDSATDIDVDMLTNLDVRCNQTPCANNRPRAYRYLASQPGLRMDKCRKDVTASQNSRCNF